MFLATHARRVTALALTAALAAGLTGLTQADAAPVVPLAKSKPVKVGALSDEFTGSTLNPRWHVMNGPGEAGKSIANYVPGAVKIGGGTVSLTTARRCGSITGPVKKQCAKPVYTSGRIDSDFVALPKGNFRVAFRAKLPSQPAQGTRWALWMKNDQGYCASGATALQGEVDVLEYYGRKAYRNQSYGVSHLSCNGAEAYQDSNRVAFSQAGWHTWSVERRGKTLTYRVGSTVVGKTTCGEDKTADVSGALCKQIFEQTLWKFTIQGEVFAGLGKDPRQKKPAKKADFGPQTMQVEWMRVYKL